METKHVSIQIQREDNVTERLVIDLHELPLMDN